MYQLDENELRIQQLFGNKLFQVPKFYVAPDVPANKLAAAQQHFLFKQEGLLLGIVDETFLGGLQNGYAFTTKRVYWKNENEQATSVAYSNLWSDARIVAGLGNTRPRLILGTELEIRIDLTNLRLRPQLIEFFNAARLIHRGGANSGVASPPATAKDAFAEFFPPQASVASAPSPMSNGIAFDPLSPPPPAPPKVRQVESSTAVRPGGQQARLPVKVPQVQLPLRQRVRRNQYNGPVIDINNASLSELLLLPVVDKAAAERIILERGQRGGFREIEAVGQLLQLQPHEVERLREQVEFGALMNTRPTSSTSRRVVDF